MVHGRELWGSAAGTGSGRSDKVNYPPGDRGRTGTAEKGDVVGDEREVKGYLLNKYNIFAI